MRYSWMLRFPVAEHGRVKNYMNASILVDTDLLVYTYAHSGTEKQQRALAVLDALVLSSSGALSTQVLAEFFVAVTHKIAASLSMADAGERIENLLQA